MARDASTQAGFAGTVIEATLHALFARLRTRSHGGPARWLVGLSGLPGSGKSTFARQLAECADARGARTEVLSLDDFYLGRRDRQQLARDIHPLLMTRGVPGTHDIGLLTRTLADLARASERKPAQIPRFDKGRDTRQPPSRWRRVTIPPRLILLEGWCIGVPAQSERALKRALNELERNRDRDGHWRRCVNAQLAGAYTQLWNRLDALIVLEAPDFAIVAHWRDEQERLLRSRRAPHAMDSASLQHFLMHCERLSRHALGALPARADLRIVLRRDRSVRVVACAKRKT